MSLFYKSYSIFKPALALKIHGRNLKFPTTQLLSHYVRAGHSDTDVYSLCLSTVLRAADETGQIPTTETE